mmetsp:Transcript_4539/g.11448  ORF Transcript_4539/g.11448 Transcript_4539/m.11448 type:complete len:176 (-) Transcript_4539:769-1296(-)
MEATEPAEASEGAAGEGGGKGRPNASRSSALLDCEAPASRLTPGQAKELGKDKAITKLLYESRKPMELTEGGLGKGSSLIGELKRFLPKIAKANEELDTLDEGERAKLGIELVSDSDSGSDSGSEDSRGGSSSSSSESTSESDGSSTGSESRQEEDEGEGSPGKKKKRKVLIEEL